jgi:hypothetical protein
VIVLTDVPAEALSTQQIDRLEQYVRDLGGSVILLGGERAFGAGGYAGTGLGRLSPLASQPPGPAMRWVLLADGSGSMAQQADASHQTRWQVAGEALAKVAGALPGEDAVSAGSFAEKVDWWLKGQRAAEVASLALPPAGLAPGGPTNLQAALQQVVDQTTGPRVTQLLLLTDAEARLTDAPTLTARLKDKRIHLSLLAIGQGQALAGLRQMAADTGGTVRTELNPARWAQGVRSLAQAAMPDRVRRQAIGVPFEAAAASLPAQRVTLWNQSWLKEGAQVWARPSAQAPGDRGGQGGEPVVLGAHWERGNGQVTALAFPTPASTANALAELVQSKTHDPRLKMMWEQGSTLRLRVDAAERESYLNGLALTIQLQRLGAGEGADEAPSSPESIPIPQVGPGEYAVNLPAGRDAAIATVRHGSTVVDQRLLAGRYAPEFERVGNDHAALAALAGRTGGRVIGVRDITPLPLNRARHNMRLDPWAAALGALLLACGAGWMRRGG